MTSADPIGNAALLLRIGSQARDGINHPHAPSPPFGLKYLQALLRRSGKRVILRDGLLEPDVSEARQLERLLLDDRIDTVVFDAQFGAGATARKLARVCQEAGVDDLHLGGCHPEATGEVGKVVPPFCSVVGIELDLALAEELCGHETTLHDLPVPSYTPWEIRRYRHKYLIRLTGRARYGHVLAGRGCPHRCAFCTAVLRSTSGIRLRMRGVVSVMEEVECRRREGANVILFGDDDFTGDQAFVDDLADRLAAASVQTPFIAHARVDELDRARIGLLARAGCEMLLFGVESAVPSVLRTLGKTPRPESWRERAVEVFAWCREAGVRTHAMFILGTPGESAADIGESLQLVRRLAPDSLQVHFFAPYPGVAARCAGVTPGPSHSLAHYETPGDTRQGLSSEGLLAWRHRFYRTLYTDRRWWTKQLKELSPFLAINPDVALALLRGLYRLSDPPGGSNAPSQLPRLPSERTS